MKLYRRSDVYKIFSDLKKTTAVVESLSTTSIRCSVTEITSLLQDNFLMFVSWINISKEIVISPTFIMYNLIYVKELLSYVYVYKIMCCMFEKE